MVAGVSTELSPSWNIGTGLREGVSGGTVGAGTGTATSKYVGSCLLGGDRNFGMGGGSGLAGLGGDLTLLGET